MPKNRTVQVPAQVQAWCESNGFSDPFIHEGTWWAFPPNGVMPLKIAPYEKTSGIQLRRNLVRLYVKGVLTICLAWLVLMLVEALLPSGWLFGILITTLLLVVLATGSTSDLLRETVTLQTKVNTLFHMLLSYIYLISALIFGVSLIGLVTACLMLTGLSLGLAYQLSEIA